MKTGDQADNDNRLESDVTLAHYERIIEISKQLNSTFDHTQLLKQIVAAATELIDTEAASIMLIDPITGELRFEISSNLNPHQLDDIIVPMDGSIAGWIATHGEPRVIQDVSNEPGHFQTVDQTIDFETRNLLGVPMRTHKKIIGVVQAVNKRDNAQFTSTDISTLNTLASQAAIAIENARLFRQSDFIAEMVHELRTPLMSIKASTSLLNRRDLAEDRREDILHTIQSETARLMSLTNDFLDLARMESGRTRLDVSPFALSDLVKESIDTVMPQAGEKGINIHFEESDFTVDGDRSKVKQVLLNLLTNAIKYNRPQGSITIRLSALTEGQDRMVQVSVEDTGYGLSKEDQQHMFQKFFRARERAAETSGTGLGLVITKAIVEAHNGHIWLESEEGQGTTFFFTLPLAE